MSNQVNEEISRFFQQFPSQKHAKGDLILRAGTSDYFFFVESGAVKMMAVSGQGQNLALNVFYQGSCFSMLTLVNDGMNKYDFIALTSVTTRKVPQALVLSFLQGNPDVLYDFQLRLLKGLQGLLNRIEQSSFVPAYKQVAGLLLYFARHFSENSPSTTKKTIEIRITHQEIAEWLGLSRENVSIQMKQLEREGLIQKQDAFFEILDVQKLEQLADPYALL